MNLVGMFFMREDTEGYRIGEIIQQSDDGKHFLAKFLPFKNKELKFPSEVITISEITGRNPDNQRMWQFFSR